MQMASVPEQRTLKFRKLCTEGSGSRMFGFESKHDRSCEISPQILSLIALAEGDPLSARNRRLPTRKNHLAYEYNFVPSRQ